MRAAHLVVGGWAAGNVVLALVLLLFSPPPLSFFLYIAASALVAGFGLFVLLAVRSGRVGTQPRQPRRARAAAFAAAGLAFGLAGFAYGWWMSVPGVYLLVVAAWSLRGERLRRDTRPWPAALDGADPAGPPHLLDRGSPLGAAVPVPAGHAAHGPPTTVRAGPRAPRLRRAILLFAGVRVVVEALRRRGR